MKRGVINKAFSQVALAQFYGDDPCFFLKTLPMKLQGVKHRNGIIVLLLQLFVFCCFRHHHGVEGYLRIHPIRSAYSSTLAVEPNRACDSTNNTNN